METYVQPDSLNLGLELDLEDRATVPSLYVRWIAWDSGLRGSGLRPGDRIVALDGVRLDVPKLRELRDATPERWKSIGAEDGTPITLTVRRRVVPGRGWTEVEIQGALRLQVVYQTGNRRHLGAGGPDEWEKDGFMDGWINWYTDILKLFRDVLGDSLSSSPISADFLLTTLLESEARVKLLEETYPGPFAAATREDFEAARTRLVGRPIALPPDALAYRERGEQLVEAVAAEAEAARAAFLAAHAAEVLPELPAVDPILDDHDHLTGKLVELPVATNRDWINNGTGTCFVFSGGSTWFFADAEGRGAQQVLIARLRYEQRVHPDVNAAFRFIGRIRAEPMLVRLGDEGRFGLAVEPVACTVGDAFFVDVSPERGDAPTFAGEEQAADTGATTPPDDAPPEAVVVAYFAALKAGDQKLWGSLLSRFSVWFLDDGTPRIDSVGEPRIDFDWEAARRKILGDVCDVQVVWADDPVAVSSEASFPNAPHIDEARVEVEHVRRTPDGEFRSFTSPFLRRLWTLQRLAGGPWRISDSAGIS